MTDIIFEFQYEILLAIKNCEITSRRKNFVFTII